MTPVSASPPTILMIWCGSGLVERTRSRSAFAAISETSRASTIDTPLSPIGEG